MITPHFIPVICMIICIVCAIITWVCAAFMLWLTIRRPEGVVERPLDLRRARGF